MGCRGRVGASPGEGHGAGAGEHQGCPGLGEGAPGEEEVQWEGVACASLSAGSLRPIWGCSLRREARGQELVGGW